MNRLKNIMVLGVIFLLVGLVYAWFYWLNVGQIRLQLGLSDYVVLVDEEVNVCDEDPCNVMLDAGQARLLLQKEGYFPIERLVEVVRGEIVTLDLAFVKIPQLVISPIIPPDQLSRPEAVLPASLNEVSLSAPAWNTKVNRLAFIDLEDNRLKLWSSGQPLQPITVISDDQVDFYWSNNEQYLFGLSGDEIYLIDLIATTRKKMKTDFMPRFVRWSPGNQYLLITDEEGALYRFDVSRQEIQLLDFNLDLSIAQFLSENELVFYENAIDSGLGVVRLFNPLDETLDTIIEADFSIDEFRLFNKAIYLRDSSSQTWYTLDRG